MKIGWTVLRDGKTVCQREGSSHGRTSRRVTPVYDTLAKARRKATCVGRTYDDIVEVFIDV